MLLFLRKTYGLGSPCERLNEFFPVNMDFHTKRQIELTWKELSCFNMQVGGLPSFRFFFSKIFFSVVKIHIT